MKSHDEKMHALVFDVIDELALAKGNCDGSPEEWTDAQLNSYLRFKNQ